MEIKKLTLDELREITLDPTSRPKLKDWARKQRLAILENREKEMFGPNA